MVPSGTCTAPSSVGLTAGSRRSASCGESGGLYASLLTGVDKGLLPCQVIFRQGDKQPIGRFNTVRAMRRRMRFSLMHSRADSLSVTA